MQLQTRNPEKNANALGARCVFSSESGPPVVCADGVTRRATGQWCAYVPAGKTLDDRRKRLSEVPEELRVAVECHVRGVFALRAEARERQRVKDARKAQGG